MSIIFTIIESILISIKTFFELRDRFVLNDKKKMESIKKYGNIDRLPNLIFSFSGFGIYRQISMKSAFKQAKELAEKIDNNAFVPTLIIGIGRGGAIFGSLLSYNLYHVPMIAIDRQYTWTDRREDEILYKFKVPPHLLEKVLLVAGEAHTGNTMNLFYQYLEEIGAKSIKTCVFYKQSICAGREIDYYGIVGDNVKLLPWQETHFIRDSLGKIE